jgi:hypothetical protein
MGDDRQLSEQKRESLQVGRLEEAMVRPNIIRPVMETKIITPDEGKGMVPPAVVHLPLLTEPPPSTEQPPQTPGMVPPQIIPPIQSQQPEQGKPSESK